MYFEPHSIYHMRLAERKELITHYKDQAVLILIDMGKIIEKDFELINPNDKLRDLMFLPPAFIEPDEPMDEVMQKFEETGSWNLPVMKRGEYIGFISKSKLFSVYRNWLIDISGEE